MATPVNVLLIDDSPEDRQIYRRFLEQSAAEYSIHEAEDGAAGIEAARSIQPDCVLLDLRLPDQSGFEVLLTLVGEVEKPKLPVIILTAATGTILATGARDFGAHSYLIKGRIDMSELDRMIQDAVHQHAVLWRAKTGKEAV